MHSLGHFQYCANSDLIRIITNSELNMMEMTLWKYYVNKSGFISINASIFT